MGSFSEKTHRHLSNLFEVSISEEITKHWQFHLVQPARKHCHTSSVFSSAPGVTPFSDTFTWCKMTHWFCSCIQSCRIHRETENIINRSLSCNSMALLNHKLIGQINPPYSGGRSVPIGWALPHTWSQTKCGPSREIGLGL